MIWDWPTNSSLFTETGLVELLSCVGLPTAPCVSYCVPYIYYTISVVVTLNKNF